MFEGVSDLFGTTLVGFSLSTLCIMNAERFLCITYPLWHKAKVTKRRLLSVCVLLWAVILLNMGPCYKLGKICTKVIVPIFSISVSSFTLFVYTCIFRVARKRLNTTRCLTSNIHRVRREYSFFRDIKMTKNYIHIVMLTCICYIPVTACKFIQSDIKTGEQTSDILAVTQIWGETLVVSLSTLNCVFFFWSNQELRKAGLNTLKMFSPRRQIQNCTCSEGL